MRELGNNLNRFNLIYIVFSSLFLFSSSEDRSAITCDEKHWLCEDRSYCIQLTERCDGTSHCPDGSDEKNCNNTCDEYKCHNGKCLNDKKLICDGVDDCGDNSDEFHCGT